jgi:uncharacterized protein (TIGR00251 family)
MNFLEEKQGATILQVRVIPRAARTEIQGEHGDELKIRLNAPPVDGKANQSLIKFLSKTLHISKGSIRLISGDSSRSKRLEISGLTAAEIMDKLGLVGK